MLVQYMGIVEFFLLVFLSCLSILLVVALFLIRADLSHITESLAVFREPQRNDALFQSRFNRILDKLTEQTVKQLLSGDFEHEPGAPPQNNNSDSLFPVPNVKYNNSFTQKESKTEADPLRRHDFLSKTGVL